MLPHVVASAQSSSHWVGVNVPGLAARHRVCGFDAPEGLYKPDARIASILTTLTDADVHVVRFWAFQSYATNRRRQRDWSSLDRVVNAAAAYDVRLIPVLGNNYPDCDYWPESAWPNGGSRKDKTGWYNGAYNASYDGYPESYTAWVREIVARYGGNPTILAWEIMNEPRAASNSAADLARFDTFLTNTTTLVQHLDPGKPVSLGALAQGEPGFDLRHYAATYAASGASLLSAHDYRHRIEVAADASRQLRRPFYVGELGYQGDDATKAEVLRVRMTDDFALGAVGVVLWDYDPAAAAGGYAFGPGSAVLTMLRSYAPP